MAKKPTIVDKPVGRDHGPAAPPVKEPAVKQPKTPKPSPKTPVKSEATKPAPTREVDPKGGLLGQAAERARQLEKDAAEVVGRRKR